MDTRPGPAVVHPSGADIVHPADIPAPSERADFAFRPSPSPRLPKPKAAQPPFAQRTGPAKRPVGPRPVTSGPPPRPLVTPPPNYAGWPVTQQSPSSSAIVRPGARAKPAAIASRMARKDPTRGAAPDSGKPGTRGNVRKPKAPRGRAGGVMDPSMSGPRGGMVGMQRGSTGPAGGENAPPATPRNVKRPRRASGKAKPDQQSKALRGQSGPPDVLRELPMRTGAVMSRDDGVDPRNSGVQGCMSRDDGVDPMNPAVLGSMSRVDVAAAMAGAASRNASVVEVMRRAQSDGIKKSGTYHGKSNALGHGGRAAQLRAKGVPEGVIGAIARAKGAAPGQRNYHGGGKK